MTDQESIEMDRLRQKLAAAEEREHALREIMKYIYRHFNELNGTECVRGCGKCIKCILGKALGVVGLQARAALAAKG